MFGKTVADFLEALGRLCDLKSVPLPADIASSGSIGDFLASGERIKHRKSTDFSVESERDLAEKLESVIGMLCYGLWPEGGAVSSLKEMKLWVKSRKSL